MSKYTWWIVRWYASDEGGCSFEEFCDKWQDSGWEIFSVKPIDCRNATLVIRKKKSN